MSTTLWVTKMTCESLMALFVNWTSLERLSVPVEISVSVTGTLKHVKSSVTRSGGIVHEELFCASLYKLMRVKKKCENRFGTG